MALKPLGAAPRRFRADVFIVLPNTFLYFKERGIAYGKVKDQEDPGSYFSGQGKWEIPVCAAGQRGRPLFLQETATDSIGSLCTIFKISDFQYAGDKLTLKALISFPEACEHISLQADLLDEDTKQVICSLEEKTIENSTDCQNVFFSPSPDMKQLAIIQSIVYT